MDRDELKGKMEEIIYDEIDTAKSFEIIRTINKISDLIAPELEKARILNDKIGHLVGTDIAVLAEKAAKWDKVRKMFFDCSPCTGCTGCDIGSSESCKMVLRVNRFIGSDGVDALEGEKT